MTNSRMQTFTINQLRIARPVSDWARSEAMYCHGLALSVLARFADHQGFDGVMLGRQGLPYHLEFTRCNLHPVQPTAGVEDLLVFYLPDPAEWELACQTMVQAGFERVPSLNPYWEQYGQTFADADGYRTVLQNRTWGKP